MCARKSLDSGNIGIHWFYLPVTEFFLQIIGVPQQNGQTHLFLRQAKKQYISLKLVLRKKTHKTAFFSEAFDIQPDAVSQFVLLQSK